MSWPETHFIDGPTSKFWRYWAWRPALVLWALTAWVNWKWGQRASHRLCHWTVVRWMASQKEVPRLDTRHPVW